MDRSLDDWYNEDDFHQLRTHPPPYCPPSAPSENLLDQSDPDLDSLNDPNQSFQSVREGDSSHDTSLEDNLNQPDGARARPTLEDETPIGPFDYITTRKSRQETGQRPQLTQSGEPSLSPIAKDARLKNLRITGDFTRSKIDKVRKEIEDSEVNITSQN